MRIVTLTTLLLCAPVRAEFAQIDLPLRFEENIGQVDCQVRYLARCGGYQLFLTDAEAVLVMRGDRDVPPTVLRLRFAGASGPRSIEGAGPCLGTHNYFVGDDPARWETGVSTFQSVRFAGVYPGIDAIWYGSTQGLLEFDLVLQPGVDPAQIELEIEGQDAAHLTQEGDLELHVGGGHVTLRAPRLFQESEPVTGAFRLRPTECADLARLEFDVGHYDANRPLVIDPVIGFSTYLGGSGSDSINDIALDSAGNAYVTGSTAALNFPTTLGAFQETYRGGIDDAFVAKIDMVSSTIVYATYLGGVDFDHSGAIAVDAAGSAYVAGLTRSANFPTASPIDPTRSGLDDAWVAKLDPNGSSLVYSTFLGGGAREQATNILVDALGSATVVGGTSSTDFPTLNPLQGTLGGDYDAFITKIDPTGTALTYSTYLGGAGEDFASFIALDSTGNLHVAGSTKSADFPTANAIQPTYGGGTTYGGDAFVARLDPTGATLLYSTYLGGSDADRTGGFAIDATGQAHVMGFTQSTDFPVANPLQPALVPTGALARDIFISKLDATGAALVFSTYLGGDDIDWGIGLDLDPWGNIYLTGRMHSTDFPTVHAPDDTLSGFYDSFLTKLAPDGQRIIYSTYLGGGGIDQSYSMVVDSESNAYLVGLTDSADYPTVNPVQASGAGGYEGFITRFDQIVHVRSVTPSLAVVALGYLGVGVTISIENVGVNDVSIDTLVPTFTSLGGLDLAADYVATPAPGNPTVIAAGATELFDLMADVSSGAALGTVVIDAEVTATDVVSMASHIDVEADVDGSWDVLPCVVSICGDCNGDLGVTIIDALAAAQHAVGIVLMSAPDFSNCNVTGALEPDPAAAVDILDALTIAQDAVGTAVILLCC